MRNTLRLLIPASLLLLAACENGNDPGTGVPAAVVAVSGGGQSAPVGEALPRPVQVRVEDARGRPVRNVAVNFVVTEGDGSVAVPVATTDAAGVASAVWTLGHAAGTPQAMEAHVAAVSGTVISSGPITATATAGPAERLEAVSDTMDLGGAVGGPARDSLALRVLDAFGNAVAGATVTWAATEGGGSISPASSASDAAGVARAQWTLGPRTDLVQGATGSVPGAGRVAFFGRAADRITPLAPHGAVVSGGTSVGASVAFSGDAGPVPGVRVRWAVLGGGGSISPETSVSGAGSAVGVAGTTWTLGPGGGTQTLEARAGPLTTTITVTAIAQGTRTLVAQVPGRVLDARGGRVLWLDSVGGTRNVRIRDLSTGTDTHVKVDTARYSVPSLYGHLFPGGALIWGTGHLFEFRGGTVASLAPSDAVSVAGDWAVFGGGSMPLHRRDLSAGTTVAVGSGYSPDVGANGDVVFLSNGAWRYRGGSLTPISTDVSPSSVYTDGVNILYRVIHNTFSSATLYLQRAGGDTALVGHSSKSGGLIYFRQAGGWIAFATPLSPVMRRAPNGAVERITTQTTATRVEALAPDGTLIYHFPTPTGRYFLVTADGDRRDVGPAEWDQRVVWRDDRFLLLSGGTVHSLGL